MDVDSGLVHTVLGTAANVADISVAGQWLHGEEKTAFGDSGYRGVTKRPEAAGPDWQVTMRPGERRRLDLSSPLGALTELIEKTKAGIRARVDHPFRVVKQQFGLKKLRYRGLAKNTARITTMFALSNLWMARWRLAAMR